MSLCSKFGRRAALALMLSTSAAACTSMYGGGDLGPNSYPTYAGDQQTSQITVVGSPCGGGNINYFPLAQEGFQTCNTAQGPVGVHLGPVAGGLAAVDIWDMNNTAGAKAYSAAFLKASKTDERMTNSALARAPRPAVNNDPTGAVAASRTINQVGGVISSGTSIINRLKYLERILGQ